MADNRKFVQAQKFKLAGSGVTSTATTLTLQTFDTPDGTDITSSDLGTENYMTLEPGTSKEELCKFAGSNVTQNGDGTATITSVTRGLKFVAPYDQNTALRQSHAGGSIAILTNPPQLYDSFANKENDETIAGTWKFPNGTPPTLDSYAAPTADAELAAKKYVDDVAAGGTASIDRIVPAATAGATISAGEIVYFDDTANEWLLADASTAATSENVLLGIAQGAGTDGNAISGGVLLAGLDSNQSGMTVGAKQFLSDTAGATAESAGTKEVTLGWAKSATEMYFSPRFDQQITEDEQDALAGSSGTPSSSNVFVTANDQTRNLSQVGYAADAEASDTYVISLSPAPTAYTAGMVVSFKANTANTGAATINVNSLGAKAIKKRHDQDLADNDIESGQVVTLVYDGTNFQMQSQVANAPITTETPDTLFIPVTDAASAVDGVTNGLSFVNFPDAASTNAYASAFIPSGATISKIEAVFLSGNTTDNFVMNYTLADLPSAAVQNTDSTLASNTEVVADTQPADEGIFDVIGATGYDSLTQGRIWSFALQRNGNHGSDTAATTIKCVGVLITYA